jgi:hypothetical protein
MHGSIRPGRFFVVDGRHSIGPYIWTHQALLASGTSLAGFAGGLTGTNRLSVIGAARKMASKRNMKISDSISRAPLAHSPMRF